MPVRLALAQAVGLEKEQTAALSEISYTARLWDLIPRGLGRRGSAHETELAAQRVVDFGEGLHPTKAAASEQEDPPVCQASQQRS